MLDRVEARGKTGKHPVFWVDISNPANEEQKLVSRKLLVRARYQVHIARYLWRCGQSRCRHRTEGTVIGNCSNVTTLLLAYNQQMTIPIRGLP